MDSPSYYWYLVIWIYTDQECLVCQPCTCISLVVIWKLLCYHTKTH